MKIWVNVEEELVKAYNEVEREADEFFETRVKERFEKYLHKQTQKIRGLLPKNLRLLGLNYRGDTKRNSSYA